ncbi:MAG: hypothetical protein ACFFDP_12175 [Promethearchaeota archaeon]
MAQDIRPKMVWKHTLYISGLMCLTFIGIDWVHFFFLGTKFTYFINPASPTGVMDFFFYLFTFAGMGFLIGILVEFETRDVVTAGILGPLLFLFVNGFIIHLLLILNPAYATMLIPDWVILYGATPDWFALLPSTLQTFWLLYLQGFILFFVLGFPFILAASFSGHAIRMLSW